MLDLAWGETGVDDLLSREAAMLTLKCGGKSDEQAIHGVPLGVSREGKPVRTLPTWCVSEGDLRRCGSPGSAHAQQHAVLPTVRASVGPDESGLSGGDGRSGARPRD